MKENKKTYWKGLEQLTNDPAFVKNADREFPENAFLYTKMAKGFQ
jgi:MoCo/4Fe-4S cofactor protein with predicted Tat translocation signal